MVEPHAIVAGKLSCMLGNRGVLGAVAEAATTAGLNVGQVVDHVEYKFHVGVEHDSAVLIVSATPLGVIGVKLDLVPRAKQFSIVFVGEDTTLIIPRAIESAST